MEFWDINMDHVSKMFIFFIYNIHAVEYLKIDI